MIIESNRLSINIAEPGEKPNDTCRFDRAGYITDITLDGNYQFCVSEPNNLVHPSSGGRGLCNEFSFDQAIEGVKIGNKFPKFGIGLFERPDLSPYCFFKKYKTQPFPITWRQTDNTIVFDTKAIDCNGYAIQQQKIVEVNNNTLTIDVILKNVGEKEVVMKEYCHNFLSIEMLPIGSEYLIEMPGISDRGNEIIDGTMKGSGKGFSFTGYNSKAALVKVDEGDIFGNPFKCKISHEKSLAFIELIEHFKPCEIAIWSIDNIISVETFYKIEIKPGESDQWKRSWKFDVV